MVTLVSWKNSLIERRNPCGPFYLSTNAIKFPLFVSTDLLFLRSIWKSAKSRFEGEIFIWEKETSIESIFFFFQATLQFSLLLHYRGYNCAIDFTKRRQEMAMPISTLRFTFPEGKWRNSLIRVTVSLFCWGKEGKGGWYFAFDRALIEGKRRRNSRDGLLLLSAPPLETISLG